MDKSRKKELARVWRGKNRAKCRTYSRKFYNQNKDRLSLDRKTPKYRYSRYKDSAKQRGIEFKLSFEQFLTFWNKVCHYCSNSIKGVGIDRIDNSKGYEIDNCVPCCEWCNKMKLGHTQNEFFDQVKKICGQLKV